MAQPGPSDTAFKHLRRLFEPRTIAIVGASASGIAYGNEIIESCRKFGFAGRIVPIHPSAAEIDGLPACRTFAAVGEPIDYAFIAVGASQVPRVLEDAAGHLAFAQIMSSGFGETEAGVAQERELVRVARAGGIRVLGPNCLGVHSPRGRLTFVAGALPEPGPVGIVTQSGGLAIDVILRGENRGLRFSGVATLGNSADLSPAELLEYFLADPDTRVVGLYIEDVKDGRRFVQALRAGRARKPVVLLIGGQTAQGRRAAASHTGALAADPAIWTGLARQTGTVLVETLDEFLDALLAFQTLTPRPARPTRSAVLFGNGGGTSVLAADAFARRGLALAPFDRPVREQLEALQLAPGSSTANPIDVPAGALRQQGGAVAARLLDIVYAGAAPEAVVIHVNLPVFLGARDQRIDVVDVLVTSVLRLQAAYPGVAHLVLVLRSDGSVASDDRRRRYRADIVARGIPIYDELPQAAAALAALREFERFHAAQQTGDDAVTRRSARPPDPR